MAYIDHRYTDDVVCPWCGTASWFNCFEFKDGDEIECDECGKGFELSVDYAPVICTEKLFSTADKDCPYGLIATGSFFDHDTLSETKHTFDSMRFAMSEHWKGSGHRNVGYVLFSWEVFPWGEEEDE
jgi:hypothetical protein